MSAIEVLKKDIISYEEIRKSGKKCLTTNNEECCFVHYPEIKEALLALEQKDVKDTEIKLLHKQITDYERILNGLNEWLKKNIKDLTEIIEPLRERDEDFYFEAKIRKIQLEEVLERVGEQK